MTYNHSTRKSLINCLYSDRPAHDTLPTDSWRLQPEPHLNPSKSKLNVRQSIGKNDQASTLNPTMGSFRTSGLFNNPSTTIAPRPQFQEDRYFRNSNKENQELPSDKSRDGIVSRYSQQIFSFNPAEEFRRKSQSVHMKVNREECLSRNQDEGDGVKLQIQALVKRVTTNQEQIGRLKQQMGPGVGWEIAELRHLIAESKQQNSNLREFQKRLQQTQSGVMELKQRLGNSFSQEEMGRRILNFEMKLSELYQGFKMRQASSSRNIGKEIDVLETKFSQLMQKNMNGIRDIIDYHKLDVVDLKNKIKSIQQLMSSHNIQQLKRSNKICINSLLIRTKQQIVPDWMNGSKFQKDFVINERTYFVDQMGYLLDENKYYLLNSHNQQIKISQKMLGKLRDYGILSRSYK